MRSVHTGSETHSDDDASGSAAKPGQNPQKRMPRKPRRSKARRGVSDVAHELVNTNVPKPSSKVGQEVVDTRTSIADHAQSPEGGGADSGGQNCAVSHRNLAPHNQAESGQLAGEDPSTCAASIDGDRARYETQRSPVPVGALCDSLVIPSRQRRAAMKTLHILNNQLAAYARSMLGYNAFADDKEADAIRDRASKLVKAIENGEPTDEDRWAVQAVTLQHNAIKPSIDGLTKIISDIEKDMKSIAKKLPVSEWVKAQKGFGLGNLAYIIAATGNLSKYSTVSKVWKRMGLAVFDGDRQGSPKSKSAEDYIAHGYNKHRRCIAYLLGESLVKGGGDYKAVYDARKEYELPRVKTKGHAHNRAMRYMTKRALADLWGEWHRVCGGVA